MVCIFRGDTDFPRKIASAFLHLFSYTITFSGTLQHRNHSYTITYITYLSPNKPWALYNKCIIHFFVHQTRSEITPQCRNFCQIRLHSSLLQLYRHELDFDVTPPKPYSCFTGLFAQSLKTSVVVIWCYCYCKSGCTDPMFGSDIGPRLIQLDQILMTINQYTNQFIFFTPRFFGVCFAT